MRRRRERIRDTRASLPAGARSLQAPFFFNFDGTSFEKAHRSPVRRQKPLPNLNHPVADFEGCLDSRPKARELCNQPRGSAIPEPDPKQCSYLRLPACQVQEILVFRDNSSTGFTRISPDVSVSRLAEPNIHHVDAVTAQRCKKPRQSCRELVVNDESHEAASTT